MRDVTPFARLLAGLFACACADTGPSDPGGGANGGSAGTSGHQSGGGTTSELGGSGGSGKAASGRGWAAGNAGSSGSMGSAGGDAAGAGSGNSAGASAAGARGGRAGASGNAGSTATESGGAGSDSAGAAGETGDGARGGSGALARFELAVIGSSTAAGEGASSSSRGWVTLLADSLAETIAGTFAARNLAVGGYTTSELLPGSGASGGVDAAIELEPDLIVVALAGSNDLSNGVSTSTFLSRLTTIRDAAVEAGIPIFFLSTAPKDLSDGEQETLRNWAIEMQGTFGSCWTPENPSYSPCFIDVFEALADASLDIASEYSAGDGIHLNDSGHARIFEIAEPIVRNYACSLADCS